ncbi:electron transport complex subunit D [Marinobacterium zhoushanense]|uniref:Ion-translocating oxidoreductase complex subunit D n=1 Tax=Marinobacterium zhoushanense TaxID=1679163 RepID=A0ABQ1KLJ1_9GAMM|nr:electron transport complex subunit RsxD [Marinobacterium zhoushanense]GGC00909.1 electron transport complex subunit D [Marinobacterium zhoushanense]
MALIRLSSPHVSKANSTANVMRLVLIATLPGILAMTFFFGWGTLIQIALACSLALAFEAAALKLRKRPLGFFLSDGSALVTAILLAVAIPPFSAWWVTATGIFFAIVIAKHLYGGLGNNPFNPAMVAYALLLVSFPVEMTRWTSPMTQHGGGWEIAGFIDTLQAIFGSVDAVFYDSFTGATPLDVLKHRGGLTTEELWRQSDVLSSGVGAWYAVSAAWFMGGIFLLSRKIFTWHAPLSMLIALFLTASAFYGFDPDNYVNPVVHLSVGATMLGAFFIATDPVTSATSNKGKMVFGALLGVLIYVIRTWGNYPDAVAFAVLLMNLCAPFIDQYTQPRSFGHTRANRGMKGKNQ